LPAAFDLPPGVTRPGRARSRRKPGVLFKLAQKVPPGAPTWLRSLVQELDAILWKFWMVLDNSLPAKHGTTHMGGSDSIAGFGTPAPVVVGGEGQRGDPHQGFAPFNHVHSLDLGPITPGLLDELSGSPNPPFRTLKQQLDWLNAQAVREYAVRPIIANTYR